MTSAVRHLGVHVLGFCFILAQGASAFAQSDTGAAGAGVQPGDGQHDFDFEFGAWEVRLRRLLRPLTGSTTWVEYEGTSVVRRVWEGRANLGELSVDGPAGHIQGLSLRLYNPQSRQWHIHWANSVDGLLGEAMVGAFEDGRGEFFNQEFLEGRAILVRFVFSDVSADSFRFEQAFSADGGGSWEANWIAEFTRVSGDADGGR